MACAYPCLYIRSTEEALPYYVDFLGFEVTFEWRQAEGAPVYMGVSRGLSPGISEGRLAIHLTEHRVAERVGILLDVEDVYAFHADLRSREDSKTPDLVDQPWGKTELHLYDPFENHLVVTSPTKQP